MKRSVRFALLAAICGFGLTAAATGVASAANGPISANDILVYQQGTAATVSSANATPIVIDEISTTGTIVQQFAIPTLAPNVLLTDNSGSSGHLSLSNNGTLLSFSGYTGSSTQAAEATSNANRAVGTLDASGTFNIAATYTANSLAGGTQPRAAYSGDGQNYYISDNSGLYSNNGTSPLTTANIRSIKNFGGTTYVLQQKSGTLVSSISPSSPVGPSPATPTITALNGLPTTASNAVDFTMVSSGHNGAAFDTLYYTDQSASTAGGIYKYALISGTWTAESFFNISGKNVTGITAALDPANNGNVDIFFTDNNHLTSSGSVLEEIVDTAAYNANLTPSSMMPTVLYTAPVNDRLQGVSFGPSDAPEPTSVGLLLTGGALMGLRRKRRAQK